MADTLKIISWNVNGIRSVLQKGFLDFAERHKPDIVCLQEVRSVPIPMDGPLAEHHAYWNVPARKGYSGTAIFSKPKPIAVTNGIGLAEHDDGAAVIVDDEGRVTTAEYPDFFLVNVYTPNSRRDLLRLGYRQKWDGVFLAYLKKLEEKKPVIFCGDLNVAHKEIDLTNPAANRRNHGFTDEERAGFDRFIRSGFLDTFREFTDAGGHYTWWSQMNNCRKRNIGWRIDYFLISACLRPKLMDASILCEVTGSDHCPVGIEIQNREHTPGV